MARKQTVADVVDLDAVPVEPTPTDPEKATDALGSMTFDDDVKTKTAPAGNDDAPITAERPKRRTKAELQADVSRLEAELKSKESALAAKNAAAPAQLAASLKLPLSMTFAAVSRVMAAWKGKHWLFEKDECDALGEAWSPCLAPLIQDNPEVVMWGAAITVTYAVAMPRLSIDKENADLEIAAAKVVDDGPTV